MIVFVHIPKTAGSTIYSVLRDVHRLDELYKLSHDKSVLEGFMRLSQERRSKIKVIYGHIDYGIAGIDAESAQYFTFLREPIARAVSFYYYVKYMTDDYLHDLAMEKGLADFIVGSGLKEFDNGMVRRLSGVGEKAEVGGCTRDMLEAAKHHLAQFCFVGLTEKFMESYALLCKSFGWPVRYYVGEKINRRRPALRQLPERELGTIRDHNRLDLELYEYGKRLFEERLKKTDISETLQEMRKRRERTLLRWYDVTRFGAKMWWRRRTKKLRRRYYRGFG